jgi:hypothetical protein
MLRPVHYLIQVEAFAVVDPLSRMEFGFGGSSTNRLKASGTNRVERAIRVLPMGESFEKCLAHGASPASLKHSSTELQLILRRMLPERWSILLTFFYSRGAIEGFRPFQTLTNTES